jgi:hypothetical protein
MLMRYALLAGAFVVLAFGLPTTVQAHERASHWTARQAESVTTIRGLRVHVLGCRGLGRAVTRNHVPRYRHFRCTAGTRAPGERYDTVAVLYVLHPLRGERFALTNVRFIGGPGVP